MNAKEVNQIAVEKRKENSKKFEKPKTNTLNDLLEWIEERASRGYLDGTFYLNQGAKLRMKLTPVELNEIVDMGFVIGLRKQFEEFEESWAYYVSWML